MRIDKHWDPVRANKVPRRIAERLRDVFCSCGYQDYAWVPVEPPAPGYMWAWKCPKDGGIMMELAKYGKEPDELPYVRGDWKERVCENFGHEPVVVKSRRHYRELLKQNNLHNQWEG